MNLLSKINRLQRVDLTDLMILHIDKMDKVNGENECDVVIGDIYLTVEFEYRFTPGEVDYLTRDGSPYISEDETYLEVQRYYCTDESDNKVDTYKVDTSKIELFFN